VPSALIVRLNHVPFIDATGLRALEEAIASLQRQKVRVVFCEMNAYVKSRFDKMHLATKVGPDNITASFREAVALLDSTTTD